MLTAVDIAAVRVTRVFNSSRKEGACRDQKKQRIVSKTTKSHDNQSVVKDVIATIVITT